MSSPTLARRLLEEFELEAATFQGTSGSEVEPDYLELPAEQSSAESSDSGDSESSQATSSLNSTPDANHGHAETAVTAVQAHHHQLLASPLQQQEQGSTAPQYSSVWPPDIEDQAAAAAAGFQSISSTVATTAPAAQQQHDHPMYHSLQLYPDGRITTSHQAAAAAATGDHSSTWQSNTSQPPTPSHHLNSILTTAAPSLSSLSPAAVAALQAVSLNPPGSPMSLTMLHSRGSGGGSSSLGPQGNADAAYLLGKYQWAKRLLAGREVEVEQLRDQLAACRQQHQEMRQQLDRALEQVGPFHMRY